jgi:hypothetical protein
LLEWLGAGGVVWVLEWLGLAAWCRGRRTGGVVGVYGASPEKRGRGETGHDGRQQRLDLLRRQGWKSARRRREWRRAVVLDGLARCGKAAVAPAVDGLRKEGARLRGGHDDSVGRLSLSSDADGARGPAMGTTTQGATVPVAGGGNSCSSSDRRWGHERRNGSSSGRHRRWAPKFVAAKGRWAPVWDGDLLGSGDVVWRAAHRRAELGRRANSGIELP